MGFDDRRYGYESGPPGSHGRAGDVGQKILRALNWSFPIGTYLDTHVRVHITFVMLLVFRLLAHPDNAMLTLRWTGVLFVSVLLHEFGHVLACRRVGGHANEILMWPLGGLAMCAAPRRVWAEFMTVVWGPLVTILLGVISYAALAVALGTWTPTSMDPANAWKIYDNYDGLIGLLYDFFNTNYILGVFNLVMVFYPFDGGRLVQVALWTKMGYGHSMRAATAVGMVGAVGVGLYGLAIGTSMLVFIAAFGFYACYQQRQYLKMESDSGDSWRDGVVNFGDYDTRQTKPGFFEQRRRRRAEQARSRQIQQQQALEKEVDRILDKVHHEGLASLTKKEKRILQEATDRQRSD